MSTLPNEFTCLDPGDGVCGDCPGCLRTKIEDLRDQLRNLDAPFTKSTQAARIRHLEAALQHFADHGTNFDTNPTTIIHANNKEWAENHQWWINRAQSMDRHVRNLAKDALDERI